MPAIYEGMNAAAVTLVSLSIILFAGFLVTRVTKLLRLPNVSGFIIAGLLIGPGALGLIPQSTVDGMSFVSDIALTFIAFNVGSYFKREVIRSTGPRILIVTLFEALLSGVVVFLAMRLLFGLSADFSLLIAAIATATAPASTMMTVRQYNAKGPFVDALMQVVALDDVVCLFVYCVAAAVVGAEDGPGVWEIVLPVVWNIVALSVGAGCAAAALCAERDILLLIDEVQTGNGRSGTLYAFEQYGVAPDIVTTAKGLGGGLPIGATLLGAKTADTLTPSSHGSTFGGNPVCAAGAVSILDRIDDALLAGVRRKSAYIRETLGKHPAVEAVDGLGLMLGVKTTHDAKAVCARALEKGLLVLTAKDKVRLLPALNIPDALLAEGLDILQSILDE